MNQKDKTQLTDQNSPRFDRNIRSKSRLGNLRSSKPIYLTDGQFSSSDHTNISSSQMTIIRIQLQSKIKKLQRQNKELKQTIISLKATQFYQLDQEKIKNVIRQNQSLKLKINQLQTDAKILDQEVSSLMIENQYLKRNNKALKIDLGKEIKQSVRQKHNYLLNTGPVGLQNKKNSNNLPSYGDEQYERQIQEFRNQSKPIQNQRNELTKLLYKKKVTLNNNQVQKQKISDNLQQMESEDKSKKLRGRNKSRYNRSTSKSGEKGLGNNYLGSKGLVKKTKKELPSDFPSTSQSQTLKHYSSSGNILLSHRNESRSKQLKLNSIENKSPHLHQMQNAYTSRQKAQDSEQYNGEYFSSRREKFTSSKKKKSIYYN